MTQPTRYIIKRQLLRLFGAGFEIEDPSGAMVGFCKQKSFRLREDIRIFTDTSRTRELLSIQARSILDFSTTYDVRLPDGLSLGSFRRKGISSTFLRDSWLIFDENGVEIGTLQEDSTKMGLVRRFLPLGNVLFPQRFEVRSLRRPAEPVATIRQHFNLLFYRLSVDIHHEDEQFDDLLILAAACLIAAIEGRQDGE